jgi:acetylornithine deacetylase
MANWEDHLLREAERRTDRLVDHVQRLVRIPSVSGDEGACSAAVAAWARDQGFAHQVLEPSLVAMTGHPGFTPPAAPDFAGRPNVIATRSGSGGGRSLALWAHLDVVPVDPHTTWTHGSWSGDLADGKVYGRGAADCKGGVAVAMTALEILRDLDVPLKGDVQAQFVVEEETGGNGTLGAILAGVRADAMIQIEPTSTRHLLISNRGAQFFRLRVPGQEGGVEYQHNLVSALDKAFVLIEAVKAYSLMREAQLHHPLYDGRYPTIAPLAVCRLEAGQWPSTVPGEAILEGTIECLPGEDIHAVVNDFEAYIRRVAAQDPWLAQHPLTFERFGLTFEAAEIPPDSPIVTTVVEASKDVLGYGPAVAGGGGSDLRLPVLYANCPTILYGPGGGLIHSVDEYVEVGQLSHCLKVVLLTAYRWTAQ